MSMNFGFARVPFIEDGSYADLSSRSVDGDPETKLHRGVELYPVFSLGGEIEMSNFGLSDHGIAVVDTITNGLFLQFLSGTKNARYLMLHKRIHTLRRFRSYIERMSVGRHQCYAKFLRQLLYNSERMIERHGQRAALIIY